MNCRSCGAAYDDKLSACPYCNAENVDMAEKNEREQIKNMYNHAGRIASESTRRTNRTSLCIAVVAAVILCVAVIVMVVLIATGNWRAQKNRDALKQRIDVLEQLYISGDYEALEKHLDKYDYNSAYGKYDDYVYAVKKVNEIERDAKDVYIYSDEESNYSSIKYDLYVCFRTLEDIREYSAEYCKYDKDKKDEALNLKERVYKVLKDTYRLKDDEIEAYEKKTVRDSEDYIELAKIATARMMSED